MKKINEALMNKYLGFEMREGFKGPKWEKYFRDTVWRLVELTDGRIFCINKRKIRTEFCFGEGYHAGFDYNEAADMAENARTNENLFRARNLLWLDTEIKALSGEPLCDWKEEPTVIYIAKGSNVVDTMLYNSYGGDDWDLKMNNNVVALGDEDKKRILDVLKECREEFAKRIDSYLKRYGLSKVTAWTYWADA